MIDKIFCTWVVLSILVITYGFIDMEYAWNLRHIILGIWLLGFSPIVIYYIWR